MSNNKNIHSQLRSIAYKDTWLPRKIYADGHEKETNDCSELDVKNWILAKVREVLLLPLQTRVDIRDREGRECSFHVMNIPVERMKEVKNVLKEAGVEDENGTPTE